uniref:Uncharacterized protein n=1 Tax=Ditylenchus dipsaci TaxID=166011 RepID=A0A915DCR4_9BILA
MVVCSNAFVWYFHSKLTGCEDLLGQEPHMRDQVKTPSCSFLETTAVNDEIVSEEELEKSSPGSMHNRRKKLISENDSCNGVCLPSQQPFFSLCVGLLDVLGLIEEEYRNQFLPQYRAKYIKVIEQEEQHQFNDKASHVQMLNQDIDNSPVLHVHRVNQGSISTYLRIIAFVARVAGQIPQHGRNSRAKFLHRSCGCTPPDSCAGR